ncbi:MAG: adenylate kinase [Candidatus Bathyarchaeota archaeon]
MKIIFLGPPGAGKGTYSSRIGRALGIPHISTGDIFREAVKQGNELGRQVSEYMKRGELVPDKVTIDVLKDRINQPDCERGFILDGYPRTITQAEALEKVVKVEIIFNLIIPEEILVKKLSARRVCKVCGENYNVAEIKETVGGVKYDMPPMLPKVSEICDRCGGELIQRRDDTIDVINERLSVYKKQTEPLIKYYRKKSLLSDVYVNAGPDTIVPKMIAKLKCLNSG